VTRSFAGLLAAGVVALAACGGGGSTASPQASAQSCAELAGLTGNVSDHGSAAAAGATIDIQAGDSFFAPTCETGVPSGTVTLVVKNTGGALHNVSIPDQGIDEDVGAGETIRVDVPTGSSPIQYFCKYHRTSGMVGALLP
jgi:plastocyanin